MFCLCDSFIMPLHGSFIFTFMHLANFYSEQLTDFYFLLVLAFPWNRPRDLGIASIMLYSLNSRKAIIKLSICVSWLELK